MVFKVIRPYNTRSKGKVVMARNSLGTRVVDPSRESVELESELKEELQRVLVLDQGASYILIPH